MRRLQSVVRLRLVDAPYCENFEIYMLNSCKVNVLSGGTADEKAVEDYRKRFLPLCDRDIVAGKGFSVLPPSRDTQKQKEPRKKGLFGRLFGG
jgi:hypothetical protein